jgi:plasmid stabilization system protein ParE
VKRLTLHPVAEAEITKAFNWYARERPALGRMFLAAVSSTLDRIVARPASFPVVERDLRRAMVSGRFPYAFYFRFSGEAVSVAGCVHVRRSPRRWRLRERAADGESYMAVASAAMGNGA